MASCIIRIISLSLLGFSLIALLFPIILFNVQPAIDKKAHTTQIIKGDNIPYESFVQVLHTTYITVNECLSKNIFCPAIKKTMVTRSKGSGMILGHARGLTYIITAQHVCEHRKSVGVSLGKFIYSYHYDETVEVVAYLGDILKTMVVSSNIEYDLCLLVALGETGKNLKIRKEKIRIGDMIINVGAPMGIFTPGMALTFDGRYSGTDGSKNAYFSIPGAPGSSGSPILDSDGALVSIVHSAHLNFKHLAIGCQQQNLINFLYENRIYLGFLKK